MSLTQEMDSHANWNPLSAHWHAPPFVSHDDRLVHAVRAIEHMLPWVSLRFELDGNGRPVAIADRDRWLLDATARGELPILCNGEESRAVTVDGSLMDATGGPPTQLHVSAWFPPELEVLQHAADLLAAVGVSLEAWRGKVSQVETGAQIADQIAIDDAGAGTPPGLPRLQRHPSDPEMPHNLGWINYWSQATCARIGFPDPARHAELLKRARQVEGGGWVVQLTDESLDLNIPAHLQALARAYDLLPTIGDRDMDTRNPLEPHHNGSSPT